MIVAGANTEEPVAGAGTHFVLTFSDCSISAMMFCGAWGTAAMLLALLWRHDAELNSDSLLSSSSASDQEAGSAPMQGGLLVPASAQAARLTEDAFLEASILTEVLIAILQHLRTIRRFTLPSIFVASRRTIPRSPGQ